jgi:hypothetical protein
MDRMRRLVKCSVIVCALVGTAVLCGPQPAGWAQEQTLQGEVVDPAAYLKDGRRGLEAEEDTYAAVDGGQTLALLEDVTGSLFLFLAEEPGEDPNELVYEYVNRKVKVTGAVYDGGGLRGLVASSVQPLEPAAASSQTSIGVTED